MTKKVSNAELLIRIDERQKAMEKVMLEMRDEVKKTNGRVTVLETAKSEARGGWRVVAMVSSVVGGALGSVVTFIINHFGK